MKNGRRLAPKANIKIFNGQIKFLADIDKIKSSPETKEKYQDAKKKKPNVWNYTARDKGIERKKDNSLSKSCN
jgi:hypothetical protein